MAVVAGRVQVAEREDGGVVAVERQLVVDQEAGIYREAGRERSWPCQTERGMSRSLCLMTAYFIGTCLNALTRNQRQTFF